MSTRADEYAQALTAATGFPPPNATWTTSTAVSGAAQYPQAWIFERSRAGCWSDSARPGSPSAAPVPLRDLWAEGMTYDIYEMAEPGLAARTQLRGGERWHDRPVLPKTDEWHLDIDSDLLASMHVIASGGQMGHRFQCLACCHGLATCGLGGFSRHPPRAVCPSQSPNPWFCRPARVKRVARASPPRVGHILTALRQADVTAQRGAT